MSCGRGLVLGSVLAIAAAGGCTTRGTASVVARAPPSSSAVQAPNYFTAVAPAQAPQASTPAQPTTQNAGGAARVMLTVSPSLTDSIMEDSTDTSSLLYAANRITAPSDFRTFEPLIEEAAGAPPVPYSRVKISDDEMPGRCDDLFACGCYDPSTDSIYLRETFWGIPTNRSFLLSWSHEQGHHYDPHQNRSKTGTWLRQVYAYSFELYFAEYIARNHDLRLGLNLNDGVLREQYNEWVEGIQEKAAELIGRTTSADFDPENRDLSLMSILVLLGSGFQSYTELWQYLHSTPHDEIAERIRGNIGLAEGGLLRAFNILGELAGTDVEAPSVFDDSYFDGFEPGEIGVRHFGVREDERETYANLNAYSANYHDMSFSGGCRNSSGGQSCVWRLEIGHGWDGTDALLRIEKKEDGKLNLFFRDNGGEFEQFLDIPDVRSGDARITSAAYAERDGASPLHILDWQDVSVDSAKYLDLAKTILERFAAGLREGGSSEQAEIAEQAIAVLEEYR